ncbi:Gmad2 immunoglobulin-like domain-containing protein [Lewinella sp. IMCC34191]|uniref:Gmad2 immunoglobulin-like domain-containing protein n=1 Tax=Lewinella sp. IMCC34191 TaxID=2259172 RepID=UPI00130056D8|nr:Gmad2 immunoglobulin-like domain-containing protein [Lewinella sp. IMCC34191]
MPVDRQTSDRATPSLESGQEMAYVVAIPDGLGTEIPVGSNEAWQSVAERQSYLGFAVDEARSQAFLLENDEVWGYLLYPATPPRGWSNNGFVFVQYAVDDGEVRCYDANGQPKARNDCDTMGHDTLVRRGTVSESSRSAIDLILNNWEFIEGSRRATDDLIRVDIPVPYMKISSPLTVSGEARGPYYFEGSFSVILEDSEGHTLTQAPATAQSDWMTNDWVPFEATFQFEAPEVKNGVVVFERANPSGLEENARRLAIPVRF